MRLRNGEAPARGSRGFGFRSWEPVTDEGGPSPPKANHAALRTAKFKAGNGEEGHSILEFWRDWLWAANSVIIFPSDFSPLCRC